MAVNEDTSKAMLITTYQKATRLETEELNVISENMLCIKIDKNMETPSRQGSKQSESWHCTPLVDDYLAVETRPTYYKTFI